MPVRLDENIDKLVVVNLCALRGKYGFEAPRIQRALNALIRADHARNIRSVLVDVSAATQLATVGAIPVADATDYVGAKRAIDALCNATAPDYVLLVGSNDLLPLVPLATPFPSTEPDRDIPSDLPYACVEPAGSPLENYIAPSRVVGRLPDLPGHGDHHASVAFAAMIRQSTRWTSRLSDVYRNHLTISTAAWQVSTGITATGLFGIGATVLNAPPASAPWDKATLRRPLHLINLHGAPASSSWLGDPGFAVAIDASDLTGAIGAGTVVSCEACSGGDVFDPALSGGALPLPVAYLRNGAYGFVGPTCISYGGRRVPDAADVLCRYLVEEVLGGASIGRAFLQARQRYVTDQVIMTPADLKTLAQFVLLADPSVVPVTAPEAVPLPPTVSSPSSSGVAPAPVAHHAPQGVPGEQALAAERLGRMMRRRNLESHAAAIVGTTAVAIGGGVRSTKDEARRLAATVGRPETERGMRTYEVRTPGMASAAMSSAAHGATQLHVQVRGRKRRTGGTRIDLVELAEGPGGVSLYRELESR